MKKQVYIHLITWGSYLAWVLLSAYYHDAAKFRGWEMLLDYLGRAGAFYAWAILLLPLLLRKKDHRLFFAWLAVTWLSHQVFVFLARELLHPPQPLRAATVLSVSLSFLQYGIPALGYFLIMELWRQKQGQLQQQNEQYRAEVVSLRQQVNPHFLFNTLGALYEQAQQKAPELANGLILLSDQMRYAVLQPGGDGRLPLLQEIQQVQHMLVLYRLRYHDRLQVVFQKDETPAHWRIVPHLLTSLVESAFKHGENTHPDFPVQIRLSVAREKSISFSVQNRIQSKQMEKNYRKELDDLRLRLEANYAQHYTFEVQQLHETFTTILVIQLV
jgi:Histidine kinase